MSNLVEFKGLVLGICRLREKWLREDEDNQ